MHGSEASEHMRRLLRDDEQVLWSTKPNKKAFYTTTILGAVFGLGFLGLFVGLPVTGLLAGLAAAATGGSAVAFLALFALFGFAIAMGLVYAMARWQYKHAEFGLTDDRAIKTSGFIGRDSSTVSLKDVRDVNVNVGLLDKVFGTGKIELQVAGGGMSGATFNYIDNPYEVLDTFEDARKRAEQAGAE